jgi:hypothetical protein
MSEIKLMQCGCRAMAHDNKTGKEICLTHMCEEPMELPNLTGREAKCTYCKAVVNSSIGLPFFVLQLDREQDRFYCGCKGWD